jgi:hypothetical protein
VTTSSDSDEQEAEAVIQEREVAAEPDVATVEEADEDAGGLEEEVEEETEEKESEKIEDRLDQKVSGAGAGTTKRRRGKKKANAKKPSLKIKRSPKSNRR